LGATVLINRDISKKTGIEAGPGKNCENSLATADPLHIPESRAWSGEILRRAAEINSPATFSLSKRV
jgi:hypothetical protein